jgi:PAS domain-containing protein
MNRDLDWASRVQRLEAEVAGLRRAMTSRAVIEQAKGVLSERLACTPDEAFAHLSKLSQESNVKLADLAASIVAVGSGSPGRSHVTRPDPSTRIDQRSNPFRPDPPTPTDSAEISASLSPARSEAYHRASSQVATSTDLPSLAATLHAASGFRVAFWRLEDAASVTELAASGCGKASATSEAVRAATRGGAAWASSSSGTSGQAAGFPIRIGDAVVGSVTFTGDGDAEFTPEERGFLAALGQLAQRGATRLWTADADPISRVLDAIYTPAMFLEPVWDGDEVIDFVIAYANAGVPNMAGLSRVEQIGRRLLDTYPHLRSSGVFDSYVEVLRGGQPFEREPARETVVIDGSPTLIMVRRRATPYRDGVLATWQRDDDRLRADRQMSQMESLGHFGWASWDLIGRKSFWSDGLYAIFDRDPVRGPEPLNNLATLAVPADREAVTAMIAVLAGGESATVDFHLRHEGGIRPVRLIAEPLSAEDGTTVSVLAVAQDLTERRRADEKMSRVQAQLAEQRFQLASQRELASALRQVLYPGGGCEVSTDEARVVGRYAAPEADVPFRGDFCDAALLPDGHVLFAIGDGFGSGARAGEVVARLLYPARALGAAGMAPSMILDILNRDLHRDEFPPLASIVVGRFCPQRGAITWAQGGHLPPVRLRNDGSEMIERPEGPALGLLPTARFAEVTFTVEPGDLVVWMTDGMVYERSRPNADPWRELRRKLIDAKRAGGVGGVLDLCKAANGDEACMLTVSVTGKGPRSRNCTYVGCAGR